MFSIGTVESYYDAQCENEWTRLERHRLEFEITKRALAERIPSGSRVLDVGGGPGRYSIFLAGRGCSVTLVDLSARNVERALAEASRAGVALEGAVRGNALELDNLFAGREFDAVLCMGPLYHLHEEEDRARAVRQCLSLLRGGGVFFASFITAFAPILDSLRHTPETISSSAGNLLGYLSDGRNYAADGFTDAYFAQPLDVGRLMAGFPLRQEALLAAEGLGILVEQRLTALPEEQFMRWVDVFCRIAGDPAIHGACEHLLYAGRKTGV